MIIITYKKMAANNGKPTPWHIPYSTLSGGAEDLPEYLGWVSCNDTNVVNLPKISTESRNMCIGAVLIIENNSLSGLYLKAADGDTIEGEQYAFLGSFETGHVVATPNGDWALVYVWVVTNGVEAKAAMPASGKVAVDVSPVVPSASVVNDAAQQEMNDIVNSAINEVSSALDAVNIATQ